MEAPCGTTLYESEVIQDFAVNYGKGSGYPLWPHEVSQDANGATKTASMKLEMLNFNKLLTAMMPMIFS